MQSEKKIKYNLILGFASEVITILLGILVPRLVLTSYGSEVNGLINTVTQVYSYVALLEAGVGTATVQALYRTIGCGNKNKTNEVLAATNQYYHRTGLLYLVAIILFSILYPLILDTDLPLITVILIIIFNGLGNVISFFFQAKYFLLLQAEGKSYVKTSLMIVTDIFKNVARILLMAAGLDVVFVQSIALFVSILQMIFVTFYIRKYYSWINLEVKPDYGSISQSSNVLVHQVSELVFNSTDNIVLSVFCGLKTVSVYSMYNLFFGMINTAQLTLSSSVLFLLGQTYHSDKKKFMKMYDCYEVYYTAITFALYSVTGYFILPFLKLYTRGVADINYIDNVLPYLFIVVNLLSSGRNAPNNVINFEGHFKQTQNRSILETVINLVVSLIGVQFLGIYGVLIGTIVALLYRTNDIIIYANKRILKRTPLITYKRLFVNLFTFMLIISTNRFWPVITDSYVSIVLWAIPYTIYSFVMFLAFASIFDVESAKYAISVIRKRIGKGKNDSA